MPETPSSHQMRIPPERSGRWRRAAGDDAARDALAQTIPRRARVSTALTIVLALGFAAVVTPAVTAERWLGRFQPGTIVEHQPAPFTVRAPMLAGYDHLGVGGGVVVARGELATHDEATIADAIATAMPRGPALYLALFALLFVLAAIFSHHLRRSTKGRLARVQLVSLAVIAMVAVVGKLVMLGTALSALVVPVAVLAMVPTLVLDRVVGLATGVLGALVVSLLAPFDVGLAILLLVQAATAGLVVAERPKQRWAPALSAGAVTTLCTGAMYVLLTYLTTGRPPELGDPLHATWLAAVIGPAIAAFVAVPVLPLYQLLVGEITQSKLIALEDLSHPLLRQIAERAPGTWQHSLMMANMAEIAANTIGASGRLVRVGAYFHDLGKSLSPKYFIENLEAGETSPHDQLPPEVSCDAIFAHVSEGIAAARKAGLHERIVDFMHMHHGNGVLEYFWARCREQGNPHGYTLEQFRYPGHPPQSRETAILTICDAVEAASRTLKKPDAASIDSLVQRIVYGKLHLGQLDESGLSMSDLRRISDSLRETIRHANHGRIEYPWQKAEQDASAGPPPATSTAPRLDSLDRKPDRDSGARPRAARNASDSHDALAATADVQAHVAGDSDAGRVRAGTARNAQPASRDLDTVAIGRGRGGEVTEEAAEPDTGRVVRASERITSPNEQVPPPAARHLGADEPVARSGTAGDDRATLAIDDTARATAPARAPTSTGRPATSAGSAAASATDDVGFAPTLPPEGDHAMPLEPAVIEPAIARTVRDRAASVVEPLPTRDRAASVVEPLPTRDRAASVVEPLPTRDRAASVVEPLPTRDRAASVVEPLPVRPGSVVVPLPARDRAASVVEPLPARERASSFATRTRPDSVIEPAPRAIPIALPARPPAALPPSDVITPEVFGAPPPAVRKRAATLPPVQSRRQTTAPPPVVSRRVEPARTAGPPEPVDLENATTNPPPLRRGPGGAALPQDPAQIAAALAAIVSRVSAAPFGGAPREAAAGSGSHAALDDRDDDVSTIPPPLGRTPRATGDDAAPQPAESRQASTTHPRPSSGPHRRASTAPPPEATRLPAPIEDDARITRPRPAVGAPDEVQVTAPHQTAAAHDLDSPAAPAAPLTPSVLRDSGLAIAAKRAASDAKLTEPSFASAAIAARIAAQPPSAALDAGVTEPSLPVFDVGDQRRIDVPLDAEPPAAPSTTPRKAGWSNGLAARIDAVIESDEWGRETPVVAPTRAELRALTGNPDPTRQQPVDELQLLQRRAAEIDGRGGPLAVSAPEWERGSIDPPRAAKHSHPIPPSRAPHPTAEVDPDDIEAAIEVAPPARRPSHANAVGAKPKKSE